MESFQKFKIDRLIMRLHLVLLDAPMLSEQNRLLVEEADALLERTERGFKIEARGGISVGDLVRAIGEKSTPAMDHQPIVTELHDLFAQMAHRCFGDDAPGKVSEARALIAAWLNGTLTEDGTRTLLEFFLKFNP